MTMNVSDLVSFGLPQELVEVIVARKIVQLTEAQEQAVNLGALQGANVLVCAPTSSGKTLVGELVAVGNAGQGLTAYLVSHKALASQVYGIFKERYKVAGVPYFRVGLLTGDEDNVRKEWSRFDVVVATYEKFYASLATDTYLCAHLKAVVADEIQLVGDDTRGPTVELLLSRVTTKERSHGLQLVGLSATLCNAKDIATWLKADLVLVDKRLPPLDHEIWLPGQRLMFRHDSQATKQSHDVDITSLPSVIGHLLEKSYEPIVIMATTKNDALQYAQAAAEILPADSNFPQSILEEFRSMGEGAGLTEDVCPLLLRRIGVHQADLSPEQRSTVENAFLDGHLRILVATPTLVAGVNLPIRTVLYPKLTRYDGTGDAYISREEYQNGSGRAGRLGYHERGTAIMLAESLAVANQLRRLYLEGHGEPVKSGLQERSKIFLLLHLAAGGDKATIQELATAAAETLWGFERGLTNSESDRKALVNEFARILEEDTWSTFWSKTDERLGLSPLGKAVAATGLEPCIALEAYEAVKSFHETGARAVDRRSIICRLCQGEGFEEFLPFPARFRQMWAATLRDELNSAIGDDVSSLSTREIVGIGHALLAIGEIILPERLATDMLKYRGERARVTDALARLLRAGTEIARAADPGAYQATCHQLDTLADQLTFHVERGAVPLARLFAHNRVKNVGPRKISKLSQLIGGELGRVLKLSDAQLKSAVGERQVAPVREAVLRFLRGLTKEQSARQLSEAKKDKILFETIGELLRTTGKSFEPAVAKVLNQLGWHVSCVEQEGDTKKPDIAGVNETGDKVIIECKTSEELESEVSQKEAFDVIKKVPDEFEGLVLTIGKPVFSGAAVERAFGSQNQRPRVRLITAGALAEVLLRVAFNEIPRGDLTQLITSYSYVDVSQVRMHIDLSRRKSSKSLAIKTQ